MLKKSIITANIRGEQVSPLLMEVTMYKLSEQPVSRIISEMPDFSFLIDTYVFTVKERFNISDTFLK